MDFISASLSMAALSVLGFVLASKAIARRSGQMPLAHLKVHHLNRDYTRWGKKLPGASSQKSAQKLEAAESDHAEKAQSLVSEESLKWPQSWFKKCPFKKRKSDKPRLYVIVIEGEVHARFTTFLAPMITLLLRHARACDEVMVRMKSPGGAVQGYGLAASELERLRRHGLQVTVCIDEVAASGGYLVASVAHRILAAPYAIVGSIGVIMQVVNVHDWLSQHQVQVEQITAGDRKRTLTALGKNTDEDRQAAQEKAESIHVQFQQTIKKYRQNIEFERVANGDFWLADEALQLGLVDKIQTSEDFICNHLESHDIYELVCVEQPTLRNKLLGILGGVERFTSCLEIR